MFFVCTFEATRTSTDAEYKKIPNSNKTFMIDDYREFEQYQIDTKDSHMWVAFNNRNYDDLMLILYVSGGQTNESMRKLNDGIIRGGEPRPDRRYYTDDEKCIRMSNKNKQELFIPNLVCDLQQISGKGSLKLKAIILNADSIMESPVGFNEPVPEDMLSEVVKYCETDLDQTFELLKFHEADLQIRDNFYADFPNIAYNVNSPKLGDEYFKKNCKFIPSRRVELGGKKLPVLRFLKNKNINFTNPCLKKWFAELSKTKIVIDPRYKYVKGGVTFSNPEVTDIVVQDKPQHHFTYGLGGLHSVGKSISVVCEPDEVIYNVDVSSYYPSMEIEYEINPRAIPDYSKVKAQLRDMREEYKELLRETGESRYKIQEQGVKLLGNASFGKLNDKYAHLYDLEALYSVTTTGQILLLKLVDMIIEDGIESELIQANTDGLFYKIKISDIPRMDNISRKWETLTGVMLDREFFKSWYQQSCNHYFAEQVSENTPTVTDYVKSKGEFLLKPEITKKIPTAKIVKLACIKYLTEGVDPRKTILGSEDVTDFIITANSTDFSVNGKAIGYKALRVVYSETGEVFRALKNDSVNGGYKEQIVLEGEKLKFLIKLSDYTVESLGLNYDKYTYEAWKLVYSVIKPRNDNNGSYYLPAMSDEVTWRHAKAGIENLYKNGLIGEWYAYLKSLGLSVIPKNLSKKNYSGIRIKDRETWNKVDPTKVFGLGIVCDTVCSIDIDNPKNLDPTLRSLLKLYPTMKVYHGRDRVLEGGKGSFIYKTTEPLKLRSSAKMVNNLGFEFLNDEGKVQTVIGVHPNCDMYQVEGEPIELPKVIRDYLMGSKDPEGRRAIPRITGKKKVIEVDNSLQVDEAYVLDMLRACDISLRKSLLKDNSLHCWEESSNNWFVVSRCNATGKYFASSNHSNFIPFVQGVIKEYQA